MNMMRIISYFITGVVFFWLAPTLARAEWPEQSCAFRHRIPVTITATGGNHSNETRIDLTSADIPASYDFTATGDDVRVFRSDDLTAVDFVIAGWDSSARTINLYVRLPTLAAGSSETVHVYLGDTSLPMGSNAPTVFPDIGLRLRSRVSTADPVSAADGLNAFASAVTDVDDSVRPSITGLNNRALGGTNGNYGWCVSAVLNVTAATAGIWDFRYGGDFGRGGHLYVRGQALEEQWNDDLWWANNYANTGETLEGSINLPVGWHRYESLGFEGCCDGPTGYQARPPGGAWQDLSSTNFDMRAAQCINDTASVSIGTPQSCSAEIDGVKSISTVEDIIGSDYALPGSRIKYEIEVSNKGQVVDADTLVLSDQLPAEIALVTLGSGAFEFTDGTPSSGLSFTYDGAASTTDSIDFSTDGVDFSYIPTTPVDPAVTHVRFRPSGEFQPNQAGVFPSFTISILGELR